MKHSKVFRILALVLTLALLVAAMPAVPAMAATGFISLTPTSGVPGSTVYVSGSGFTPGSTATVFFQATPVAWGLVTVGGTVTIPFLVPIVPRGSFYPVTVTTNAVPPDNSNTATFAVTPQLTLVGASSGFVGDQVTVSGNGFQASSSVDIKFDTTTVATVTASVVGIISNVTFTVPASARGSHTITGVDSVGASSGVSFTVLSQIAVQPTEGGVGDQVAVSGTGFAANKAVTITLDDVAVTTNPASVTTDIDGSFTATFTVPAAGKGEHTIKAQDADGNYDTATFTVGVKMTITPVTGFVGDQVTVSGTGFAANSSITITLDDVAVATTPASVTTGANGSFTATITVPAAGQGEHTIKAQDADGNYDTATFTVVVKMDITPITGFVGDQVTVNGTGFGANKAVTITLDGVAVATEPASVATDAGGSFSATFIVPDAANGAHTIKAQDTEGNSATATFTVQQEIAIDPQSGLVGDGVSVSGTGFGASQNVTILFDNFSVGTATTGANGSFADATFTVPPAANGNHTIKAQDASGNFATATFTVAEEIAVTPATNFVGDQVTVSGTGFGASRSVTLYFDNVSVGTATTDADGNFAASLTIPASARGSHVIKAQDSVGNAATATVTTKHKMAISPTTGVAGTAVTVSGSGFGANSQISIKFNNIPVSTSPAAIVTGADGSFTASFALPPSPAGSYTVEVSDGTNSATANFTAVVSSTISQTTTQASPGHIGMEFTISGTGFKANATVTVTYETEPVVLATTDSSGSFSVTFTIPASLGGEHTITVSDGETSRQFAFFMESNPPPPPRPLLPPMGFKPKQPVTFDWEGVTDASPPVTYSLQIARDSDFSDMVLAKTGLTDTQYTLTEEEELESVSKEEPYYWRVRAIDGAQNESLWSGTGSFTVGFSWPDWIIYLWFGLGLVVAGILGFFLGRRVAFSA